MASSASRHVVRKTRSLAHLASAVNGSMARSSIGACAYHVQHQYARLRAAAGINSRALAHQRARSLDHALDLAHSSTRISDAYRIAYRAAWRSASARVNGGAGSIAPYCKRLRRHIIVLVATCINKTWHQSSTGRGSMKKYSASWLWHQHHRRQRLIKIRAHQTM